MKPVLDACCGSRMFWFDKNDERAIFLDNRLEDHEVKDRSCKSGVREIIVSPDIVGDFTALPFKSDSFYVVVFDPPHLLRAGDSGWQVKKYGKLTANWEGDIKKGFSECFRVLRPGGVLIFKWSEVDIPVSRVLVLSPHKPLVGQRSGKAAKTHWLVFMKPLLGE